MEKSESFGRTKNLALNSGTFEGFGGAEYVEPMTIGGAVAKTGILLALLAASAAAAWLSIPHAAGLSGFPALLGMAALAAFIVGLVTTLNMRVAPVTAPLYAVLEGAVLGGLSAVFEAYYPGIVVEAVLLTFGVLFSLLLVYRASGYEVTGPFRAGVLSAMLGIVLVYLVDLALQALGVANVRFIHDGSLIGIGFSLFVVVIAALNLVLDFDLIARVAREGAPRYMEWYAAYGVMVTLVWLYLEVLKLLMQMAASRDDD